MADMMGAMGGGMAGMSHGAAGQSSMGGMDHGAMAGMNHGSMQGMNHAGMAGMDHGAMAAAGASTQVRHARTEYDPSIGLRVDMARPNLAATGIWRLNNGRRVPDLADYPT